MIGDLILIFIFVIIWKRILGLKKTNFREFIFEITIYLGVFVFALVFYKTSYFLLSFIFDFGLFPSIVGVFALSFILIYGAVKFVIYYLRKRGRLSEELREKIINKLIEFYESIIKSERDFEKAFMIFFVINAVVILTLFNSLIDVFTHQKILRYEVDQKLRAREESLVGSVEGPPSARNNIKETLEFLRIVDPRAYEKIVKNTTRFVFSSQSISPILATAHLPESYIEIDPIFSKPFNSLKDKIYFSSLLVHETEHIKNYNKSGFVAAALTYTFLKLKCNPLTNYQYFSQIRRAVFMYEDEWCAQISEVKFLRQFNIDYREDFMKYFRDN